MIEFNTFFMNTLVEAHQEDLRKSARPPVPGSEPGPVRKTLANSLIRLGERLQGDAIGKLERPPITANS